MTDTDPLPPAFQHSRERFEDIKNSLKSNDDDFKELNDELLPGLADLLSEIVDVNLDVSRERSMQRLLKVFFDSKDNSNEVILNRYTPEVKDAIEAFAKLEKSAAEIAQDFHPEVSPAAMEELPKIDPSALVATSIDADAVLESAPVAMVAEENISLEQASSTELLERPVAPQPEFSALMVTGTAKVISPPVSSEKVKLYEDPNNKVEIYVWSNIDFQNWGRTVSNKPVLTFVPRTSRGVQEIVKYAKERRMNVRAAGYRHSWSPIFGKDGQIFISTLGLLRSTWLPNLESLPGSQYFLKHTELNSIDFFGTPEKGKKRLVRVGTAATNQQFRRWCNAQNLEKASTLPLNVIMVEITLGGSNAPICHGAGREHTTLSDLVYAIEYIDVDGNMRALSKDKDPDFMSLAGGCFGLLGIVTHITLEIDPMSYAVMTPRKLDAMKAIPPPPDMKLEDIPVPLRIQMSEQEQAQAQAEFEQHARSDFYAEWFWYPYTSKVWVNCWNVVDDPKDARDYPSKKEVVLQWIESVAFQLIAETVASLRLQNLKPDWQVTAISRFALYAMPDVQDPKKAIKTQLPNGLHFRRAIQNTRVRDLEIEIPLQPKKGSVKNAKFDDPIDFTLVQRAWWDAILLAYRHDKKYPQRMPLEMRITGPSQVTMAPYRGHNLGTCSIEILTLENMKAEWNQYAQECLDLWMSYKDSEGKYLNSRPHWAKEWAGFTVRGQPMDDYLKDQYKDALVEFRTTYARIAKAQGWSVADARQRFSNDKFESLFWDNKEWKEEATPVARLPVQVTKAEKIGLPTASMVKITP